MSKRNVVWLVVIVAVAVLVGVAAGPWWGVIAGAGVLVISEAVERVARQRRRAAKAADAER